MTKQFTPNITNSATGFHTWEYRPLHPAVSGFFSVNETILTDRDDLYESMVRANFVDALARLGECNGLTKEQIQSLVQPALKMLNKENNRG